MFANHVFFNTEGFATTGSSGVMTEVSRSTIRAEKSLVYRNWHN